MTRTPALLALISAVAAALPSVAMDSLGPYAFELQPAKVHEVCVRIDAGQSRWYEWSASAPTDFNIHYHRGDDVFYPVKKDATRGEQATFTAKTGEDYCLMWTALKAPAQVRGVIK